MNQRLRVLAPGLIGAIALAALVALAHSHAHAEPTIPVVRADTSAKYLRPGDVLFNYKRTVSPAWWAQAIASLQSKIQVTAGIFNKSLRLADPNIVHAAVYVGDGVIAEAYGTSPDDQGVQLNSLDKHPSEMYTISRPVDPALAKRAAEIAKTWSEGRRMTYKPPFSVMFGSSSFGPKARAAALVYGKGARDSGGPKSVSSMFCSQLIIAIFQAAGVSPQLATNPKLRAAQMAMPRALAVDAVNASPLAMVGAMRSKEASGKLAFVEHGKILIDPTLPPRPGMWDRVKSKFPKIFK